MEHLVDKMREIYRIIICVRHLDGADLEELLFPGSKEKKQMRHLHEREGTFLKKFAFHFISQVSNNVKNQNSLK